MTEQSFGKQLTANDTGESLSHQAGIHIPKSQTELIAFLPFLDPDVLNPSVWIDAVDEDGVAWRFRYIYYNNRLHVPGGTRNEYRMTHMTAYFRSRGAKTGQRFLIAGEPRAGRLRICTDDAEASTVIEARPVELRGWRRVH